MRQTILDVLFRLIQILLRQNGSHKLVDICIIVKHLKLSQDHLILALFRGQFLLILHDIAIF